MSKTLREGLQKRLAHHLFKRDQVRKIQSVVFRKFFSEFEDAMITFIFLSEQCFSLTMQFYAEVKR